MRRIPLRETLLSASATATSAGIRVTDYRNAVLAISGSSSAADLKVFIKGSIGDTAPTFSIHKSARTPTNNWEFLDVTDMEDGASIDGLTGVALSGNAYRLVKLDLTSLDFIAVSATAVVAGTVTVTLNATTNE